MLKFLNSYQFGLQLYYFQYFPKMYKRTKHRQKYSFHYLLNSLGLLKVYTSYLKKKLSLVIKNILDILFYFFTYTGQCVINSNKILNFDNGTILAYQQKSNCYSIAVADCSLNSQFIVAVKKSPFISNSLVN